MEEAMRYQNKKLRHEVKYMINQADYEQLKSRLNHLIHLDENVDDNGSYHIRSLYFDDYMDTAYYEKEDGIFHRKKYRIRIYNFSDQKISLELKEKFDKYISKTSTVISRELLDKIIAGSLRHEDVLHDELLLEFYIKIRTKGLNPRVIVDYVREPFTYKYGNVRITFDQELKTALWGNDIFSKDLGLYSVIGSEQMILEVKYDDYIPRFIDQSLSLYHQQIVSASKFTMCCDIDRSFNWKGSMI